MGNFLILVISCFLLILTVKEFLKSTNICQSTVKIKLAQFFFDSQCTLLLRLFNCRSFEVRLGQSVPAGSSSFTVQRDLWENGFHTGHPTISAKALKEHNALTQTGLILSFFRHRTHLTEAHDSFCASFPTPVAVLKRVNNKLSRGERYASRRRQFNGGISMVQLPSECF